MSIINHAYISKLIMEFLRGLFLDHFCFSVILLESITSASIVMQTILSYTCPFKPLLLTKRWRKHEEHKASVQKQVAGEKIKCPLLVLAVILRETRRAGLAVVQALGERVGMRAGQLSGVCNWKWNFKGSARFSAGFLFPSGSFQTRAI